MSAKRKHPGLRMPLLRAGTVFATAACLALGVLSSTPAAAAPAACPRPSLACVTPNDFLARSMVFVPTAETSSLRFFLDLMVEMKKPIMFVGGAGVGKTQLVKGKLGTLPEEIISLSISFNYFTDVISFQKVLPLPDCCSCTAYAAIGACTGLLAPRPARLPLLTHHHPFSFFAPPPPRSLSRPWRRRRV